jgi:hypothetical protein
MRTANLPDHRPSKTLASAFTLAEVVMAIFVVALVFGGMITAYIQSAYRCEWSGYALAAQSLAIQQIEQAKAAVWDTSVRPARNEITNLNTITPATLDLPVSGTNIIWATNFTTISTYVIAGSASVYMVKVDTVWPFTWRNGKRYFTNTVADYFAPE